MSSYVPLLVLALGAIACTRESGPEPAAAATPAVGPNANAARYGPHGVTQVPAGRAEAAPSSAAPPLDPARLDAAGHPCTCGGSCQCGHCAGMIAGCHCKPKRADGK